MTPSAISFTTSRPPVPLTGLIGRDRERAALVALLSRGDARLVTLTGPGGVGKTRLAIDVAAALREVFGDRIAFVDLANVHQTAVVLPTIARALGLHEEGERPLIDQIAAHCGDRRVLLVLDNFEQITGASPDIPALLAACPAMTALVTSRSPLRIRGEREFPASPLPAPDPARLPPLPELAENPAVALFLDRARAIRPDLALTAETAGAIAEICARLDGLPLALELAAARVKLLPPAAMLPRLANRLSLLTGGPRDLPERQQTLRDAIDWSHDLLSGEERVVFRRLAVFAGTFALDAAEAIVVDPASPAGALDAIEALVDQSLLRQTEGPGGEARTRMLETIREFASEQLDRAGEAAAVRGRHLAYFAALAERASEEFAGPEQGHWLDAIESDLPNIRAAMEWAIDRGEAETARAMVSALLRFWEARAHVTEGRAWHDRALEPAGAPTATRARALSSAATLARRQGDFGRAVARYEESLAIYRELGDRETIGSALNNLGVVSLQRGDLAAADAMYAEALASFRALNDQPRTAAVLNNLGMVARRQRDLPRADALYREALELHRALGDRLRVGLALNNLGVVAYDGGDVGRAVAFYEEAVSVFDTLDDRLDRSLVEHNLAEAVRDRGELARAAVLFGDSLAIRAEQGDRAGIAECLAGLADLGARRQIGERAARLAAASDTIRGAIGASLSPAQRESHDRIVAGVRKTMTADAFNAAWQAGAALSLADAAALGVATAGDLAARPDAAVAAAESRETPAVVASGLTKRELDVLRLVVEGRTDKEIGEALFISHRTAMTHVLNILNKLGVNSRTAAAAWAIRNGLTDS